MRRPAVVFGRRVAADHRVGRVAGLDHLVGGVAHREGHGFPSEHLRVECLLLLGVFCHELEPHEFSGKQFAFGHDVFSFHSLLLKGYAFQTAGFKHCKKRAILLTPQKIADNTAESLLKGDQTMKTIHWSIGTMLLAFVLPLAAESVNWPTNPQTAPMTAQEKKNLDMVMTW